MTTVDKTEWRKKRLEDFISAIGEQKAAGVKLGYKDGVYLGQLLRAKRTVGEKLVEKIEKLEGFDGWFDLPLATQSAVSIHQNSSKVGEPSPSAMELARAFDAIPVSEYFSRIKAYNAASTAIFEVLEDLKAKGHTIPGF